MDLEVKDNRLHETLLVALATFSCSPRLRVTHNLILGSDAFDQIAHDKDTPPVGVVVIFLMITQIANR